RVLVFQLDGQRLHGSVHGAGAGQRGAGDHQLDPAGGGVPLRRDDAGDVGVLHPRSGGDVVVQVAVVAGAARHQVGDRARQRRAVDADGGRRGRGAGVVRRVDVDAELGGGLVVGQVPVGVVDPHVQVRVVVGDGDVADVGVRVAVGVVAHPVGEVGHRGPLRPVAGGARVHGEGGVGAGPGHRRV